MSEAWHWAKQALIGLFIGVLIACAVFGAQVLYYTVLFIATH